MCRMFPVALVLVLGIGVPVVADPPPCEPALEILLALKELEVDRESVVVRDVEFWEKWAPRLRAAGRMVEGVTLPGEEDRLCLSVVGGALRRPLDAVGLALGPPSALSSRLLGGTRYAALDARLPPGEDPIPEDVAVPPLVRDLACALAALEDLAVEVLPEGRADPRLVTWLREGVPSEELTDARAAFERYAETDLVGLVHQVRRLEELAWQRGIDDPRRGYPRDALLRIETPRGLVIVGTKRKDEYAEDAWLIVDPGGNDVWTNNAGGTAGAFRACLAVDLAGNDRYASERPFVQGAAQDGVGLLLDLEGNDVYRAGTFAQGAAAGGVGLLRDRLGRDAYEAKEFAQGAAALGYGTLHDGGHQKASSNDDVYTIDQLGQGLGRTLGCGVLLDNHGNDRYTARPVHESFYSKWTNGRTIHWSWAQGCGFGFYGRYEEELPDGTKGLVIRDLVPGGVGMLIDDRGDDAYEGSMYAQGTAYFYGLGILSDGGGNDRYTATWYGQGAAPHFACGILVDFAGDDHYEGINQVQGNARDFATAVFLDLGGDDVYVAEDRAQGCGDHRDAWGFFLDASGDDHYTAKRKTARGWTTLVKPDEQPTEALPYADYGVFLDAGGTDVYEGQAQGADGTTWIQAVTGRGIGIDR